ncbi:heterogeneous nuclear ribonucleoprotein Q-like isoform X4 [Ischnura elegans]|uniref:heterogeneous nuclear ribonucleoprotein Q-like isoform X4 n=1 Tax=Ischnura elegans TaxID=197161 RepID=UPI001ED884BA|nr:heterogeneous nuclear ribonucleoprotein Q-like isoform X4 [Ischnura elegans]
MKDMTEEINLPTMDQDESGDDNIVVTLGPVIQPTFVKENVPSEDFVKLISCGFDEAVATKLDEIFKTGKLAHSDLDDRALDALKEFPVAGALNVLMQFMESNLEHVSNKSAYLCGIMKTLRQKNRVGQNPQVNNTPRGPNDEKIKSILERTGYPLDITTGQRKYGGPPPEWNGPTPGNGCELNEYMIKPGKPLKVNISVPNLRLFVGNIPKSKGQEEIFEEFGKMTVGLTKVIIYSSPDDEKKNRGFCFLEYESHKAASLAKRRLSSLRTRIWGLDIFVDWADPQEEPDEETMSKVKVLYVRNLTIHCTEQDLKSAFEIYGHVERIKKIKDYAFVHFEDRECALKAMAELNGLELSGSCIEVSLAKPPFDKKKKEVMLRAREKRTMMMLVQRESGDKPLPDMYPARHISPQVQMSAAPFIRGYPKNENYVDFENLFYGDYRGGYNDPLYDDQYGYEDFYYDCLRPSQNPSVRQPIRCTSIVMFSLESSGGEGYRGLSS